MTPAQRIEISLRAAKVMRTVSSLIGVHDETIAALVVNESVKEFAELAELVKSCGKPSKGTGV